MTQPTLTPIAQQLYQTQSGQTGFFFGDEDELLDFAASQNAKNKIADPIIVQANDFLNQKIAIASTLVARYNDNLKAIKLLQTINDRHFHANPQEQKALAAFTGWGGFASYFDESNTSTNRRRLKLKTTLTTPQYDSARTSILNAYFTPEKLSSAVYKIIERAGFNHGNITETSAGVGGLIRQMPAAMFNESDITLIEKDDISAEILTNLFPTASVFPQEYQQLETKSNQNLIIQNPPFGEAKVFDPFDAEIDKLKPSLHNYFMMKGIKSLDVGGLMIAIVSTSFLDSKTTKYRELINQYASLQGAIRLPMSIFKEATGANASVDLLLFQRHDNAAQQGHDFINTNDLRIGSEDTNINEYFLTNPSHSLGEMTCIGKGAFKSIQCVNDASTSDVYTELDLLLNEVFPQDIYHSTRITDSALSANLAATNAPISSHNLFDNIDEGFTLTPEGVALCKNTDGHITYEVQLDLSTKATERLTGLVKIKSALKYLIASEQSCDDIAIARYRNDLNTEYDRFIKRNGCIHDNANQRLLQQHDYYLMNLLSLEENYTKGLTRAEIQANNLNCKPTKSTAMKAAIFTTRLLYPIKDTTFDTPTDALWHYFSHNRAIDLTAISALCNTNIADVKAQLIGSSIFKDPTCNTYVLAQQYLAGDVKTRYEQAVIAANSNAEFDINVTALKAVLPTDLCASEIAVQISSAWLPTQTLVDFFESILKCQVEIVYTLATWHMKFSNIADAVDTKKFGTALYPATKLIPRLLNGRDLIVKQTIDGVRVINRDETIQVESIAQEIVDLFEDWIWQCPDRRADLEKRYNDQLNRFVKPNYNAEQMVFPDQASNISLRPHQKRAAMRGIVESSLLIDHVVGAGKSFVLATIAKSLITLGISDGCGGVIKKVAMIMPNHLIQNMASEFLRLYPTQRVIALSPDNMSSTKRKTTLLNIANLNSGIVLIPESNATMISTPTATETQIISEEIAQITDSISLIKSKLKHYSVRRLETKKLNLEASLKRLSAKKSHVIDFEHIGFNALLVDEWHGYKNQQYSSVKLQHVRGCGNPTGSKKAWDLFLKARYLRSRNPHAPITFATGTVISNSLTELHTVFKQLDYNQLCANNDHHLDAWLSKFAQITDEYELNISGRGLKQVSRLRKYNNLPELTRYYSQYADVVTDEQLAEFLPRLANGNTAVPQLKGGEVANVLLSPDAYQEAGFQSLIERAKDYRNSNIENDNPLLAIFHSKCYSLDPRILDPHCGIVNANRKSVACAENVLKSYKEYNADKGVSIVFCDLSVPKKRLKNKTKEITMLLEQADNGDVDAQFKLERFTFDEIAQAKMNSQFSVYEDLRNLLIEGGIPACEIAFAQDYSTPLQKKALHAKLNEGTIRVVITSTTLMGTGCNVQRRLVSLHNLDLPYKTSDMTQRIGRIRRQNNMLNAKYQNFEVAVFNYLTRNSLDSWLAQILENKALFIEQFQRQNISLERHIELESETISYAEMKAEISGNKELLELVRLQKDVEKLAVKKRRYTQSQHSYEDNLTRIETRIANLEKGAVNIQADIGKYTLAKGTYKITASVLGLARTMTINSDICQYLEHQLNAFKGQSINRYEITSDVVCETQGFTVRFLKRNLLTTRFYIQVIGEHTYVIEIDTPTTGQKMLNAITRKLMSIETVYNDQNNCIQRAKTDLDTSRAELGKPFKYELELKTKKQRIIVLKHLLQSDAA